MPYEVPLLAVVFIIVPIIGVNVVRIRMEDVFTVTYRPYPVRPKSFT